MLIYPFFKSQILTTERIRMSGTVLPDTDDLNEQIFMFCNKAYCNRPNKNKIRRLFLTTGNFNLLNCLTIIKQFEESDNQEVENTIIVESIQVNQKFAQCNERVARLANLKNYYCIFRAYTKPMFETVLFQNALYDFDEVYIINLFKFVDISYLWSASKISIVDESVFSKSVLPCIPPNKIDKFIGHRYLGKIDAPSIPELQAKTIDIDETIFRDICRQCSAMYSLNIQDIKLDDKYVIFCGQYLPFVKEQPLIDMLISRGYKVLYKPHPRCDTTPVIHNVRYINSVLPLESYDLDNIVAMVSFNSSVSLQSYYFNNVPGFYISTEGLPDLSIAICEEYAVSWEQMLKIDATLLSGSEIKDILTKIYVDFIKDKPMLSDNKRFHKLYLSEAKKWETS